MQKQSIQYDSPLDALVVIAKRLSLYETEEGLSSEDFFNRFRRGAWGDDAQAVEWANDYRHYLALPVERPTIAAVLAEAAERQEDAR